MPAPRRQPMAPALCTNQAPVPPPSYHRTTATALHLDALTLATRLHLLEVCRVAVQLAQQQCPPPLPAGSGGAPRVYSEASLLLVARLRCRVSKRPHHVASPQQFCNIAAVRWCCATPPTRGACRGRLRRVGWAVGACTPLPHIPEVSQR